MSAEPRDGAPTWNGDFRDIVEELLKAAAEFILIGAHAVAIHGAPRATGDLDVFVRPSSENARRVVAALRSFGAPLAAHGVNEDDFAREGTVYQIGLPPRRIDLVTSISGVGFDEAWASRASLHVDGREVPAIGRDALIKNKRASGRLKDLLDLRALESGGE